jgi:ketosteroid isomerase-like protein
VPTNREVVLASIEALSRGDFDEGLDYWADDCLFVNDAVAVDTAGAWRGPEGFKAWLRETREGLSSQNTGSTSSTSKRKATW